MSKNDDLKLVFILKVGYNSKREGTYEFIFSKAPYDFYGEDSDLEWSVAASSQEPTDLIPDEDYIHEVIKLKTKKFNLMCLHESDDRPYEHGYYTIQALAYEDYNGESDKDDLLDDNASLWNDLSVLVFHYGMSKNDVLDLMGERDFVLDGDKLVYNGEIKS